MHDWMSSLAEQYARFRTAYPDEELLIVYDIDGTILDMRYQVLQVLLAYDRAHDTQHFYGLRAEDITAHENHPEAVLESAGVAVDLRPGILEWYFAHLWSTEAMMAAHMPFRGVLETVRWFQIQPHTHVGLNTGRPEKLRADTLRSLNEVGAEYRVSFSSELLFMNPNDAEVAIVPTKVEGLEYFRDRGFRTFAVIDNEPENIEAMAADGDPAGEILFLHADTIFESRPRRTPRTVSGREYDITRFLADSDLDGHVQFVWHRVDDESSVRRFLSSRVHWGECDVRIDPLGRMVLRQDSYEDRPWHRDEKTLLFRDALAVFRDGGKAIKVDLKEDGGLLDRVIEALREAGFGEDDFWFNANIDVLGEEGFRRVAAAFPEATRQCAIDFLAPLMLTAPEKAYELLDMLASWGINRFSVSWKTQRKRQILRHLLDRGYALNIYNVPDLESFLQAALLLPRSITSEFDDPSWLGQPPAASER